MRGNMSYIDLHWEYCKIFDNKVELKGAYIIGPALKDSHALLPNDNINLDFTKFYCNKNAIDSLYVVNFEWKGIKSSDSYSVRFKESFLKSINFDLFQKIGKYGFIRISLVGHDDQEHYKNIFYNAEVLNT
jgi:hypothetical protein